MFCIPKDAVDLATGEDIHKLVDLLKIVSYFQFQDVLIFIVILKAKEN